MRVKKQLFSVGKGGVKPSHVRSLNTLIAAHTLVKVKVRAPHETRAVVGGYIRLGTPKKSFLL